MSERRGKWRVAVGALLSVAFFWLAARGVSWSQVTAALAAARYGLVALAITFVVVGTVLRTGPRPCVVGWPAGVSEGVSRG